MRIFTALVKAYYKNKIKSPNLSRLVLYRNLIYRRLLSTLPSNVESHKSMEVGLNVTALTRIVVIVFVLGVTFPVAYKRPLETLIESVKQLITLH
jgi:hypothetical protein